MPEEGAGGLLVVLRSSIDVDVAGRGCVRAWGASGAASASERACSRHGRRRARARTHKATKAQRQARPAGARSPCSFFVSSWALGRALGAYAAAIAIACTVCIACVVGRVFCVVLLVAGGLWVQRALQTTYHKKKTT